MTLQHLEEKLFEQKQQNFDDQIDMMTTGNKLVANRKNSKGEIYGIHDVVIISNRTGRNKILSENEPTEREGIVTISNIIGGTNEMKWTKCNRVPSIKLT